MSQLEKPMKISKQLRLKAQEFLSSKKNSKCLEEIVGHYDCGMDLPSCLLALELIFTTLLKERDMLVEVVPLKPMEKTPENLHKQWMKNAYEECYTKVLRSLENGSQKIQIQGLSTAMNILSYEGNFPWKLKGPWTITCHLLNSNPY
ncbi:hypothetical protein NQ318_002775 [Aromia moschata]|uniref:Uncharacterized protein n=1 Tax=Aromia moschata TaxID=1265417 RepID=A0AAV8XT29_9CUCU|nr:hypothetical protein NQ318_002775 [Aromia moschata]